VSAVSLAGKSANDEYQL